MRFHYLFHVIDIVNLTELSRYIDQYKYHFLYTAINNNLPHQMVCGIQWYVPRSKSVGNSKWLSPTINVWQETIVKQHMKIFIWYEVGWHVSCQSSVLRSTVVIPVLFIRALNFKIHRHNHLNFNQMCTLFFKFVLTEYQYSLYRL